MENSNQFILLRKREFGEIINEAFKIIKHNFKAFLLGFMIFVLPTIIIGSVLLGYLGGSVVKLMAGDIQSLMDFKEIFSGVGLMYFFTIIGGILSFLVCYAIFICIEENGGEPVEYSQVQSKILSMFLPVLTAAIYIFLMLFVPLAIMLGLAFAVHIGLVILVGIISSFILIYLIVPLQYYPFILVRESLSHTEALKRSFELIKDHWWPTFGLYLVASIIASLLSYILVIPGQLIAGILNFSSIDPTEGITTSFIWVTVGFFLMNLGSLFCQMYIWVCLLVKYYDLVERKDNTGLRSRIETLGTHSESMFDNEGEF